MFTGLSVALAAAALVVRLRRSSGYERQQLKWIAFAAALTGVAVVADRGQLLRLAGRDTISQLRIVLLGIGFSAFPVAAGMAILRYRLYDIDVVINRTLVYGALTGTLGATYLGACCCSAGLAVGRSGFAVAGLDAGGGGAVPAGAAPDPGSGRPALLPPPLRRRADARGVRRAAARRGRPRGAGAPTLRAVVARHRAARARLAVAATGAAVRRRSRRSPALRVAAPRGRLAIADSRSTAAVRARRPTLDAVARGRRLAVSVVLRRLRGCGALIVAARRPRNPIGWLLGVGRRWPALLAWSLSDAVYGARSATRLRPPGGLAAWIGTWPGFPSSCRAVDVRPAAVPRRAPALAALAPGRLAAPAAAIAACVTVSQPPRPGPLEDYRRVDESARRSTGAVLDAARGGRRVSA